MEHFDLKDLPESTKARTERVNAVLTENGFESFLPAPVVDKRIDFTKIINAVARLYSFSRSFNEG